MNTHKLTPTYTIVNITSSDGGIQRGTPEYAAAMKRVKEQLESTRRKGSRSHTPPKREEGE